MTRGITTGRIGHRDAGGVMVWETMPVELKGGVDYHIEMTWDEPQTAAGAGFYYIDGVKHPIPEGTLDMTDHGITVGRLAGYESLDGDDSGKLRGGNRSAEEPVSGVVAPHCHVWGAGQNGRVGQRGYDP